MIVYREHKRTGEEVKDNVLRHYGCILLQKQRKARSTSENKGPSGKVTDWDIDHREYYARFGAHFENQTETS
jgi:hypothetical protein